MLINHGIYVYDNHVDESHIQILDPNDILWDEMKALHWEYDKQEDTPSFVLSKIQNNSNQE